LTSKKEIATTANTVQQTGHITYTIDDASFSKITEGAAAKAEIKTALDKAVKFYNTYTNITKQLSIQYEPSVATADGNFNGTMRFGPNREYRVTPTLAHEIAHIVGVGTVEQWSNFMVDGKWTGKNALAQLRSITGDPKAILYGDKQHFWPYGINFASEVKSDEDIIAHCKIVVAMRKDMGLE
jgi:hypothetical protein